MQRRLLFELVAKKDYFMNQLLNKKIFILLFLLGLFSLIMYGPIYQNETYHLFAESRSFLGIPNFGDVVSNLAFVLAGFLVFKHPIKERYVGQTQIKNIFAFFTVLLGVGSAYYHWNPSDNSLFWDRVSMLTGFSVIFLDSCILFEIIPPKLLSRNLVANCALFVATAIYWKVSLSLSPYVLAQFFTMFAFSVLVVINYKKVNCMHLILMMIWYFSAKLMEDMDHTIFDLSNGVISGHTLKHLAYAYSMYVFGKYMGVFEARKKS